MGVEQRVSEIKVMNNDEIRDFCIKKDLKIFELEQKLQQKENIIKEVREKLLCYGETFDLKVHQEMQKELLKILDDEKV